METLPRHARYDAVVAGARVAGAATGMLLARRGWRVLVVDPLPRGRDTLSTHALMRGAVLQLHRWGLLDRIRAAGTPRLGTTSFDYGDEEVSLPITSRGGVDALYAPRRTVLDPILVEAAEAAGAEVLHGIRVEDVVRGRAGGVEGVWLEGPGHRQRVDARWVIGADGVRSRVARRVGAEVRHRAHHSTASIYGYWPGLPDHETRWIFRPRVGAGIIPTNDGMACVFVSVSPSALEAGRREGLERLFRDAVRAAHPGLADLVAGESEGTLRAFTGLPGFVRRSTGSGWALVGDAGYFRDPLTAHGISDALRDAELLVRALAVGTDAAMRRYESERDRVSLGLMQVTDRIASLDWSQDEVKALHLRLSREMKEGTRLIQSWDDTGSAAA